MATVRVYVNNKWVPFDSLQQEQQLAIRKKIGEIIGNAIRQQIKELCSAGKFMENEEKKPQRLSAEG